MTGSEIYKRLSGGVQCGRWHPAMATTLGRDYGQGPRFPVHVGCHTDANATTAYVRVNQTLYACDAKTGKARWSQSAGTATVDWHEMLPAPTIAGDAVYAVLGDHKLHAFAASSGAPLWPTPFAAELPIHTQPVVANGLVYTGADGGWCYALDAATGTIRWKTQLLKPTSTAIDAQTIHLAGVDPA